jgi:hypothetical protein
VGETTRISYIMTGAGRAVDYFGPAEVPFVPDEIVRTNLIAHGSVSNQDAKIRFQVTADAQLTGSRAGQRYGAPSASQRGRGGDDARPLLEAGRRPAWIAQLAPWWT